MTRRHDGESSRILEEYRRRSREIPAGFYDLDRPANLFARHGQERALIAALRREKLLPLAPLRLLEVGCGQGQWLSILESFGATRERLAAIELDPERAATSAMRFAGADVRQGDASALPWESGRFDVVLQSTVFTSILDQPMREAVAGEMLRVLAPGGVVLWYDFTYDNPGNPNVHGLGRRDLEELFPRCKIVTERVTLAPPIARRVVPVSRLAADLMERLKLLNTHFMATIRRKYA